jgi:hypothetical protein
VCQGTGSGPGFLEFLEDLPEGKSTTPTAGAQRTEEGTSLPLAAATIHRATKPGKNGASSACSFCTCLGKQRAKRARRSRRQEGAITPDPRLVRQA